MEIHSKKNNEEMKNIKYWIKKKLNKGTLKTNIKKIKKNGRLRNQDMENRFLNIKSKNNLDCILKIRFGDDWFILGMVWFVLLW